MSSCWNGNSVLFHSSCRVGHTLGARRAYTLVVESHTLRRARQELEINVKPRKLTIAGKHQAQEESKKSKTIYSERCAKEIRRVVYLPADVDGSKASATLKDGILSIELPKAAHAKAVRVEPKAV